MGLLQEMMGGAAAKVNQDARNNRKVENRVESAIAISSAIFFRSYDVSDFVDPSRAMHLRFTTVMIE
jgi:hypothetical protein